MAYRTPNAIPVVVLMALALAASLFLMQRGDVEANAANVTTVPTQIGEWVMVEDVTKTLDQNVMKQIEADSFIDRWYQNPAGQRVELLLVYRRYGRREFYHRPESCFPAAGYTITKKGTVDLPYAGRKIEAVQMRAEAKGLPPTNLAYFFASGRKTESNFMRQQWLMAFERIIPNKNGWTLVRLQSPRITTDADADAAQKDFMAAFAAQIEIAITTDGKPTTVAQASAAPPAP